MKTNHICPKCGGQRILLVEDVAHGPTKSVETGEPRERFDAVVCESCAYTELYAKTAIVPDGQRVRYIGDVTADVYDPWSAPSDPETEEFYEEGDWPIEEPEITEISRVEKRPAGLSKAKVVLTSVGGRSQHLLSILRDTLGLTFENEKALKAALPLIVLDNISMEAARGLKKLLEDVGATVEVHSKTT